MHFPGGSGLGLFMGILDMDLQVNMCNKLPAKKRCIKGIFVQVGGGKYILSRLLLQMLIFSGKSAN